VTGTLLADRDVALEAGLAAAVVDTLLREDYAGLAGRVRATGAGMVLDWPGGPVLPLRPDGFLADFAVSRQAPLTLKNVGSLLAAVAPAADAEGVAAFGAECQQALATLRLRDRYLGNWIIQPRTNLARVTCRRGLGSARPGRSATTRWPRRGRIRPTPRRPAASASPTRTRCATRRSSGPSSSWPGWRYRGRRW